MRTPFRLIASAFLLMVSIPCSAGSYAGFDLCKPSTPERVKKILENAGATNVVISPEKHLSIDIEGDGYPVANGVVKVQVSITNGILFSVYVSDETKSLGLLQRLMDKYGVPKTERVDLFVTSYTSYKFQNKQDPQVFISSAGDSAQYQCDAINNQRIARVNQKEARERKKSDTGKSL